jgi:hypothetical protein
MEHGALVSPFGFGPDTPLVPEQCEAVHRSLQPNLERYSYTAFEVPKETVWVRAEESRTLRTMTVNAVAATRRTEACTLRTLLKMPTGTGKTLTSLAILSHMLGEAGIQKARPVVVIAPTLVLTRQMELAVSRFTTLSSIVCTDTASVQRYTPRSCSTQKRLAALAEHQNVIILLADMAKLLLPGASVKPWFLIIDEVQDVIYRPRQDSAVTKKPLAPLKWVTELVHGKGDSEHLVLLSATPEAALKEVTSLLCPASIKNVWPAEFVDSYFSRHVCSQNVKPRRKCKWQREVIVTSALQSQSLYDRLQQMNENFNSKDHDPKHLALAFQILHRLSQRPPVTP